LSASALQLTGWAACQCQKHAFEHIYASNKAPAQQTIARTATLLIESSSASRSCKVATGSVSPTQQSGG
jgi:hypothetical protein